MSDELIELEEKEHTSQLTTPTSNASWDCSSLTGAVRGFLITSPDRHPGRYFTYINAP